jgi:hypothetical protein
MPPRTRADDKASRSGHVRAHTPARKRGPSNAGDQASKRQKKHQEDPDDTPAQPEATQEATRGMKTGKKRGGKTKKGKKARYAPYPRRSRTIDNRDGPRLQENERRQGCGGCQSGPSHQTHPVSPPHLFYSFSKVPLTSAGPSESSFPVGSPSHPRNASGMQRHPICRHHQPSLAPGSVVTTTMPP